MAPVVPDEIPEANVLSFGRIRVPDTAGITFIPVKLVITAGFICFPTLEPRIWGVPTKEVELIG